MVDSPLVIFHLDLKVAQFKRPYLKSLFVRLRRVGYTHVCFEIEDKVRLDTCPEAAWPEAYSKEEFASILADAKEAGLEAIPLVQTFGHLEYVLRHARFAPFREDPICHAQICPSSPGAVDLVEDMCAEVRELFDNPALMHIGGDETRQLGACPKCADRVRRGSGSRLYVEHMRNVCEPLIAAGTRPIFWADMVLGHPDALELMPREAIFCDWDYWTGDEPHPFVRVWTGKGAQQLDPRKPARRPAGEPGEFPEWFMKRYGRFLYPQGTAGPHATWFYAAYLRAHGYDVIVAPTARCSGDNMFFPSAVHMPNCVGACAKAILDRSAMGVLLTSWAVRLNHLETQWLSIAAPAMVAATGKKRRSELMETAAETLGFGDGKSLWRVQEALGRALPFTQSKRTLCHGLYGPRREFAVEVAEFFKNRDEARAAAAQVETQLAAYDEVESALESMCRNRRTDLVDTRHWVAALHGLRQKAHQFLALAEWHERGGLSAGRMAEIEHELAAVWDEHAACFQDSYTPGTLHRELMMRFGAEWRHLVCVA